VRGGAADIAATEARIASAARPPDEDFRAPSGR